jgi:hypothetical protein
LIFYVDFHLKQGLHFYLTPISRKSFQQKFVNIHVITVLFFPGVYFSFILLIGNFLLYFLASLCSRFPRLSSIILELVEPIVPVNCFLGRYCEVRSMAVLYVGYWSWRRSDTPAVGRPITYQLALPCGMFPFTMEKTLSRGL